MVEWEDPQGARTPNAWRAEAMELKSKPYTWGVIATYPPDSTRTERQRARRASSLASSITRGKIAAFTPKGSFEALSRLKDGDYKVYARYIGEEEEW